MCRKWKIKHTIQLIVSVLLPIINLRWSQQYAYCWKMTIYNWIDCNIENGPRLIWILGPSLFILLQASVQNVRSQALWCDPPLFFFSCLGERRKFKVREELSYINHLKYSFCSFKFLASLHKVKSILDPVPDYFWIIAINMLYEACCHFGQKMVN